MVNHKYVVFLGAVCTTIFLRLGTAVVVVAAIMCGAYLTHSLPGESIYSFAAHQFSNAKNAVVKWWWRRWWLSVYAQCM